MNAVDARIQREGKPVVPALFACSARLLGQGAGFGSWLERFLQRRAERGQLLRAHGSLHSFEQLPFFFADVVGQLFHESWKIAERQSPLRSHDKELSQFHVLSPQLCDDGLQFRDFAGGWKYHLFFRIEVDKNLLLVTSLNLFLPAFQINRACLQRPVQAHTQSQRMLVLAGERDKVAVTQHLYIMPQTAVPSFARCAHAL